MQKPQIQKLKNGTTLLLSEDSSTEAVSLIVYIGAGSRYEDDRLVGMTHFLEHLVFDGTKKRPTSLDVSKEIDAIGADVNAHPMEELTNYHIKAAAEHLDTIVDIFADMLTNPLLSEKDILKERQVVIEEIKMRTDIPSSHVFNIFDQAIFGGNPLGRYGGGEIDKVEKFTRDDVLKFYQQYYLSENVYIAVCGNFNGRTSEQVATLIEEKFTFPAGKAEITKSLNFDQERLKFLAKDTQQTNFVVGYYGCGFDSEDRLGLKMLSIILGGNMSSRMFTEIREKKGLAYDVRTYSMSVSDTGALLTIAGVADEKAEESLKEILEQYEKIKSGVSKEELEMARSYVMGQMKIAFEDSYELADFYISQLFYTGEVLTLSEISEKIAKISLDDIKNLAQKYIDNRKLSVAVIAKEEVRPAVEKVINNLE